MEQEALQYRERYGDGFSKKLLQQPNGLPVKSLRGQEEDGKVVRIEPRKEDARREEHKRELDTKRDIRSKDEKKDERKIEEVKSNGQKSTNDGNSKPVKVDEKETSNKPAPTVTPINADKQTKPVAAAPEEPTEKHRKSDPVHKVINIRASLVGLLLSKHTLSKVIHSVSKLRSSNIPLFIFLHPIGKCHESNSV